MPNGMYKDWTKEEKAKYMREYTKRNRAKINEYHRLYTYRRKQEKEQNKLIFPEIDIIPNLFDKCAVQSIV